jgi:rhodanese-related sulfurtransferase
VLSPLAARKAEKLGYNNVKVFHAGLPAWKKAAHIVVSNIDGLDEYNKMDASYILIDLRPAAQVEKGHIPKAVALPEGGIGAMKDQFPKYKGAAVILYNQDGDLKAAEKTAKEIAGWGYKNVTILSGGFQAWEKADKDVAKGPAASKIAYVRKLLPGEFEVEAFKMLVEKPDKDTIILDVRAAKELEEGVLPNTRNIPVDELELRFSELPKDKLIVIHCSTGVRAEMAHSILKKAGLASKYVKAKVDFDKEKKGQYAITEE